MCKGLNTRFLNPYRQRTGIAASNRVKRFGLCLALITAFVLRDASTHLSVGQSGTYLILRIPLTLLTQSVQYFHFSACQLLLP